MTDCPATRHDTRVAYDTYRCRCPRARALSTLARKRRHLRTLKGRPGRVLAVGTVRRLRALAAIGWSLEALATELDCPWQYVARVRAGRRTYVLRGTHTAVARLYDRLADTSGPSNRARLYAASRAWLPPLWWDDDTIDDPSWQPPTRETDHRRKDETDEVNVERARAGQPVDLTRAERLEAVRRMRVIDRLAYDAIADRLGVAERQVHRDLTDLDLTDRAAGAA